MKSNRILIQKDPMETGNPTESNVIVWNQTYNVHLCPMCFSRFSLQQQTPSFVSQNLTICKEIQKFINSRKVNVMILEYLIVMSQYFCEANDMTECEAL